MFRPCIDLHEGKVKQIVGSTLDESGALRTNFVADAPSRYYAELYKKDGLTGGHVIMLGPGNEEAALEALRTYPGGLQAGGGIRPENARTFLDAGASHVIVTSYVFREGKIDRGRLNEIVRTAGRDRLVLDLSCRLRGNRYFVVTDRWQKFTSFEITRAGLEDLAGACSEFLVHAVDVEGKCEGIDLRLVRCLAGESPIPTTYAGGARELADLERVHEESGGRVDLTIGSALDIFGGNLIRYEDCVAFNRRASETA